MASPQFKLIDRLYPWPLIAFHIPFLLTLVQQIPRYKQSSAFSIHEYVSMDSWTFLFLHCGLVSRLFVEIRMELLVQLLLL